MTGSPLGGADHHPRPIGSDMGGPVWPGSPQSLASGQAYEAVAWLWERLAVEDGETIDRSRLLRAVEEASELSGTQGADQWWRWLLEAGDRPGHRIRVIDCTLEQVIEVAREGAQLILHDDTHGWLAVARQHRGRMLVIQPFVDTHSQWCRPRDLRQRLRHLAPGEILRCVVIEPSLSVIRDESDDHGKHVHPWRRLWSLLRPEGSDIWIVCIFSLTIGLLTLATPLAVEALVNTVAFGRFLQPVFILAMMLMTFLSFSAALRGVQSYVVEIIQRRLFARVVADLAYRLPRVRIATFDAHPAREVINYFFEIVTVQKVVAQLLLDGISLVLGALIGMAVLAFYHPWLLGFDIILIMMITTVITVLGRGAVATSIKESKAKFRMASWLESLADGSVLFHQAGGPELAWDRSDRLTFEYLSARRNHFRILIRQIVFALAMQAVASTILLGLGGWLVISGQLSLGQLVASELIVTVIVGSVAKFGKHMESFYDVCASIDKLGILFDLPIERQEGLLRMPDKRGEVVLRDVGYRYPHGKQVLSHVNIKIEDGERVALVGPEASGKSTLLDLLYGLRFPTTGYLSIHGIDPRELRPSAWRRVVALARDAEVIPGTVAENVHLSRPDISSAEIRVAIEHVGLTDVVAQLPQAIETELPSDGAPLSPTQRRKLALARAIVGRPALLLVDGLLDGLPDEEAEMILRWLCAAERPWKLLLVTGRRTLIELCQRQIELPMSPPHPIGSVNGDGHVLHHDTGRADH